MWSNRRRPQWARLLQPFPGWPARHLIWEGRKRESIIASSCFHRQSSIPLTLPEGQENHRLDGAELEHRVERRQQVPRGKVEQIQPVQGQRHRDVVDHRDVDVATVSAEIGLASLVSSKRGGGKPHH